MEQDRYNNNKTTGRGVKRGIRQAVKQKGGKEMATYEVVVWAIVAIFAAMAAYRLIIRIIKRK